MEDEKIIELYWQRSQDAIAQTDKKYGRLCKNISYNILSNKAYCCLRKLRQIVCCLWYCCS